MQWGAIGAERLYAQGRIYNPLMYGFLAGAIIPFPIYFLTRRYPNSFVSSPPTTSSELTDNSGSTCRLLSSSTVPSIGSVRFSELQESKTFSNFPPSPDGFRLHADTPQAPYNLSYMTPAIPLALFFQGYLRQRKTAWWSKYNYIVSSALTSAVSIFGIMYVRPSSPNRADERS